jgi:hypothetical protein
MKKDGDKEVKSAKELVDEKVDKIEKDPFEEAEEKKEEEKAEKTEQNNEESEPKAEYNFKLTFATYIATLGTMGWQSLGKLPNPATGKIEINLIQTKEVIDLLEILDEKTKGNLTKDEDNILKTTLSNLRINYVEELKKASGGNS